MAAVSVSIVKEHAAVTQQIAEPDAHAIGKFIENRRQERKKPVSFAFREHTRKIVPAAQKRARHQFPVPGNDVLRIRQISPLKSKKRNSIHISC